MKNPTTVRNKAVLMGREAAKKRKDDAKIKIKAEKMEEEYSKNHYAKLLKTINDLIYEFQTDFNIEHIKSKWSRPEWIIRNNKNVVLCTITLGYYSGTFDGSDDCRDIPYSEYAIEVFKGSVSKSRSSGSLMYVSEYHLDELEERFAKVMSQFY